MTPTRPPTRYNFLQGVRVPEFLDVRPPPGPAQALVALSTICIRLGPANLSGMPRPRVNFNVSFRAGDCAFMPSSSQMQCHWCGVSGSGGSAATRAAFGLQ